MFKSYQFAINSELCKRCFHALFTRVSNLSCSNTPMMLSVFRASVMSSRSLHLVPRKPFKEVNIPVPWGKIAGKWWGPTNIKPILCLHGIQDNCGAFEPLVTFLDKNENLSFLAIDFPGHGYSSPLPIGSFYHFYIYPSVVKRIIDYFEWENVPLMGHSLGAMTAFSYSVLFPEKVKYLICIDCLQPFKANISAETLRKSIDQFVKYDDLKLLENEPASYDIDEAIEKCIKGYNNAIEPERIPIFIERNLTPSKKFPGKYYFSRDHKLKMKVVFDWPQEQIVKDVSCITQPIFICKANHNIYYGPKEYFHEVLDLLRKSSKDCDFHYLDGNHYLHMNNPEVIGEYIKNFLNKHYEREASNLTDTSPIFCDSRPSPLESISKL